MDTPADTRKSQRPRHLLCLLASHPACKAATNVLILYISHQVVTPKWFTAEEHITCNCLPPKGQLHQCWWCRWQVDQQLK